MKWLIALFISCAPAAQAQTLARVSLGGGVSLAYYVASPPAANVRHVFIVVQGYNRDANRTFAAAEQAVAGAGFSPTTLIAAPIFQVPPDRAKKCHFPGVPDATASDALWTCGGWSGGGLALNAPLTSFTAMDQLLAALAAQYPAAKTVTLAGFSAGGQFVQRYAAFASPPQGLATRYVVSDPSAFLYFDTWRPIPTTCPTANDWKWGLNNLPADLTRSPAAARAAYIAANIRYLEGALDTGDSKAAAYKLLERGCEAEAQGAYRLDRGEHYAAYDKSMLAHGAHPLTIVPGCAHAVTCVFPSPAARPALFGP